jgi:hypothetical protein
MIFETSYNSVIHPSLVFRGVSFQEPRQNGKFVNNLLKKKKNVIVNFSVFFPLQKHS